MLDVLIKGGTLVDGTGGPSRQADLGIRDGRIGFVTSTDVGIAAPDENWGVHFQVRTLSTHTPDLVGTFRYAAAFDGV